MAENPEPPHDPGPPEATEAPPAPPGPPRRRTWSRIASWLLILAAVAASQSPRDAGPQTGPDDTMSLQLMGRYAVGMKSILGDASALRQGIPQMEKALEVSDNPRKHLFFIPILMELDASDQAYETLERLAAEPGDRAVAGDAAAFLRLYRQGYSALSPEQFTAIYRYGWSGKLALAYGREDSDPVRQKVVRAARRTFIASGIFALVAVAALAAGAVLLVTAVVLRGSGRLKARLVPPESTGETLLEAFALFLSGLITLPAVGRHLSTGAGLAASFFTIPVIVLALAWPAIRGSRWRDVRAALGWHRGEGVLREIGAGIVGYLAGLPLLALALVPVLILSRFAGSVPSHPIVEEISGNPLTIALILALGCLWAPVVEETFFRGMLFGHLRRRRHWAVSAALTGLVFAAIHPQGWMAVPLLGTIGFTLGAIREWRGSIIAPMTAHALNNGAVLLLATILLA